MPELDPAAGLRRFADKLLKERSRPQGDVFKPEAPNVPPLHVILYVHIYKCKSCGRTEEHSNTHLIAAYPPCNVNSHYFATKFIGQIPEGVPRILSYLTEERDHDWCKHCFPATEVKHDPRAPLSPTEEIRPPSPSE